MDSICRIIYSQLKEIMFNDNMSYNTKPETQKGLLNNKVPTSVSLFA